MPLAIRVQFLAGYSGREWPPSPARLFKALVSSARAGWSHSNRKAIEESLRVLEQQGWTKDTKLPEIVAPRALRRGFQRRRFVPNNSVKWPALRDGPEQRIEDTLHYWDIEAPHTVWYWWPNVEASHVPVIREVSRRVASVGKGEDIAVLDATEVEPPTDGVRWRPAQSGVLLEVPEPGCLAVCDAVFSGGPGELPPTAAGIRAVSYAFNGATTAPSLPTFVLGLWRNNKRCSWDARLLQQVVGSVRHLLDEIRDEVVDLLARSPGDRRAMEILVRRILLGQEESGKPIAEPHLAILPIPSVLGPYPDGRIRRIAIADLGGNDDPQRRAIVELAQVLLHGRELRDNGRNTGVVLGAEPEGQWLSWITWRSRSWATVTPLVQVAKELTATEWVRLRQARRDAARAPERAAARETHLRKRRVELIARAIEQAVAGSEARIESIEFGSSSPITGVHVATKYRTTDYLHETPRLHVRVKFDRAITGPLAIGRGRHVGFGVLWPVEDKD